jgi:type VI secretion system protein ImpK
MATALDPSAHAEPHARPARRGQLAILVQEILTAATRFRTGRQVAKDAEAFRRDVKLMVLAVDEDGRRAGYGSADVKYALYAVIAYVDETVLNSGQAAFESWTMRPLQDEIFGRQVAGEAFFQYLSQLMSREDSEDVADVLEVYLLCLLLGFRGRYASAGQDALDATVVRTRDRIGRIRGPSPDLAPEWAPPTGGVPTRTRDVWLQRLGITAIVLTGLWIALFLLFTVVLRLGVPAAPQARADLSTVSGEAVA